MVRSLGAAAAFTLLAGAANAQLTSGGGPIQVSSDNSEVRERQQEVIVTGNVDIVQGNARLRADRVTLNYESTGEGRSSGIGGGFGDITSMTAEGEVFYVTPDLKARGDRGVYQAANETIVMTGEVILSRGEDIARGCELNLDIAAGRSTLTGCNGRVQMVIIPTEDQQSGGEG